MTQEVPPLDNQPQPSFLEARQPYAPPRLVVYGDIRTITQGIGVGQVDDGSFENIYSH